MTSTLRSRWAAIGAAVAISLGAGGFGFAHATSPSAAAAFVPITPCRVFDTRPASEIGPKAGPFGTGDSSSFTGRGPTGECATIPDDATGLALNVTAVAATQPTFLTVWGDGDRPNASSLNPDPGSPPTPNGVTTDLTGDGHFHVFNLAGEVHVFADAVGYYTDHHHDDRYPTRDEVGDQISDGLDARKFVNIDTMRNVGSGSARAPIGGPLDFDTSLVVPPDYTPGTTMTLRVTVFKLEAGTPTACVVDLQTNYVYADRPSTGAVVPATRAVVSGLVSLPATARAVAPAEFAIGGPLQPGDSLTIGLFPNTTSCPSLSTGVQSAAIYYD